MLPIEKLNREILNIHDDPARSAEQKAAEITSLIQAQRKDAFTTGASIHYYKGEVASGTGDPLEMLKNIRVAIAHRISKGQPDGIGGSAGGLAKRVASTRLDDSLSKDGVTPKYPDEALIIRAFGSKIISHDMLVKHGKPDAALKAALLNVFDDVVETPDGGVTVTNNNATILKKNIRREAREELGPRAFKFMQHTLDKSAFKTALTGIIDDRYVSTPSLWKDSFEKDGLFAYPCTATTVYMKIPAQIFNTLIDMTKTIQAGDGEITGLTAIPLVDLLTRISPNGHGNPGHQPEHHYRHTHEGLVAWKIAADLLGQDSAKMLILVEALKGRFPPDNPLNFTKIAAVMKTDFDQLDRDFSLPAGSFAQFQRALGAPPARAAQPRPTQG
ncbi:MAG: hypothetical protein ACXW4B_09680 [Micavibrio sp.]